MRTFLTTLLLTACLSACSSSDDDSHPASSSGIDNELSPASTLAEAPPTGTTLPADLRPPQ
jgi:hypothetical protein